MNTKRNTHIENVLHHLKTRGSITAIEAVGLYGNTQLGYTIFKLREQGHNIITDMKKGVRGTYGTYRLVKTLKKNSKMKRAA